MMSSNQPYNNLPEDMLQKAENNGVLKCPNRGKFPR